MDRFERECQAAMHRATDYAGWKEAALELDRRDGAESWASEDASDDYDWRLIRSRLRQIRQYRSEGATQHGLRSGLRRGPLRHSYVPFGSGHASVRAS